MRVAFVCVGNPEDVNLWSGIPHSILRELRRQVSSVEVISLDRSFRYLYAPLRAWHAARGTRMQLDRHPFALQQYRSQVLRQLRGRPVDALLATSSVPVTGLKLDMPVAFWTDAVVDAMMDYYPAAFSGLSARERQIAHRQEEGALASTTHALYSSQWAVDTAQQYHPAHAGKLRVVEFGANLVAGLDEQEAAELAEARLRQPELHLLFVGVDWERKGGPIALETTRLLRERGVNARLHVAGCPSPPAEFVTNYGFLNRSVARDRERMAELFRKAAFFLFPTRAEAAGIVFAEASSFALPILATETGGVGSYVRAGVNGALLPPDAPAVEYADAIERITADSVLYAELSAGGYREFTTRLNWPSSVAKAVALLR